MSNTVGDKIFRCPIVRTRALLRARGTAMPSKFLTTHGVPLNLVDMIGWRLYLASVASNVWRNPPW